MQIINNMANQKTRIGRKHKIIALKIQQKIFQLSQYHQIDVLWLPAHCGIILHDEADTLACQGAGAAT